MKEIELTQGKVTLVDDYDYDYIMSYGKWRAMRTKDLWYAIRTHYFNGIRSDILMHRIILDAPESKLVDHKDHDGLNNQRSNLRICNYSQNHGNRIKDPKRIGFKGVTKHAVCDRWQVYVAGKYIGLFACPVEAAHAYDAAAKEHYGEFALTNF